MNVWLINGAGLLLMAAIVGWFWLWPRKAVAVAAAPIDIRVENGVYTPDTIEIRSGHTATLRFHRIDPSPCAEQVVFHGLDVSAHLPVGNVRSVDIAPQRTGTYRFTCQMNMYQGTLRVVD